MCAVVMAGVLFVLMMTLIRTPRAGKPSRTFSVSLLAERPPVRAAQARQPHSRQVAPSAMLRPMPRPSMPVQASGRMRSVARPQLAPVIQGRIELTVPSLPRARVGSTPGIHWRRALGDYFKRHNVRSAPFSLRALPLRKSSVLELPERMRLSSGAEIDRIGDRCYDVPASNYQINRAISPQFARVMQGLQPLFAHEVPCSGTQKTPGEEFLEKLRKRGYGGP
ncbi:MAG: hypothetical protein ACRETC_08270 [Gammaproteobacteria bacterium]